MKGWRRENPDCNPSSEGCPRDFSWLEGNPGRYYIKWHWAWEVYSREVGDGHQILSVEILRQSERLDSAPFHLSRVPWRVEHPFLPRDLPPWAHEAWWERLRFSETIACPLARRGYHAELGVYQHGGSTRWSDYKDRQLRGISPLLDSYYKEWRRFERAKLRDALIAAAEKIL